MIIKFIKKISRKILYNDLTHFYGSRYITYKNIKKSFFKKKKIYKKNEYIYFLLRKLYQFNIKERLLKKIFISIYTIIHELSADCSIKKIEVSIENKVKKINLGLLNNIFKQTLPSGLNIKLKDINKSIIIFNKYKTSNGLHKIIITEKNINIKKNCIIFYNIIISLKKKSIIDIKKNVINNRRFVINDNLDYEKYNNHIIGGGALKKIQSYKEILDLNYSEYKIKKEKNFICKYKHISSFENYEITNIKKKYTNKKDNNKILTIKDAIISFRGLISFEDFIIKESIGHSIWDPPLQIINKKIIIPGITKEINSKTIILPTAINNIGHYTLESLIRLKYLKKKQDYKIIVFDKLTDYLEEILFALGIKDEQILKKKNHESWKLKELLFPIIPWFEVSKNEAKFLANSINRKIIVKEQKYERIYISRRDNTQNRNLINEIEIECVLQSLGFKIIIASKLNIYEKINIFENAKIIITTLGSAVHNFLFCKKINAKIILIGTRKYFIKDYIQYAYLKNLNIYFLEATEIPSYTEAWKYNHSSFFLNEKNLQNTIKKII